MIRKIFLYFFILNVYLIKSPAQEIVTGLQSNHALIDSRENLKNKGTKNASAALELPFFDDFSGHSVFPDNRMWTDDFVFINNTYSDRQITTGVATFDAIDNFGRLYTTASSSGFEADHLTSQPVNLAYSATDNIRLSFFYQAGGLGDFPEARDSLTLQFYAPIENAWYSVWRAEGYSEQKFKPVIIPIKSNRFLKDGFQFRFINYASLSQNLTDPSMVGNCDIWNIDYVVLDKNRNAGDTVFTDVAFRLPIRSLLKGHEAMPWRQFKEIQLQEMSSVIPVHYRNNDTIVRNITRNFEIRDVYKNLQVDYFSAGATNIDPLTNVDYDANLIYSFQSDNNDSALFRIICSLKTDEFDPKGNDTIIYYQVFNNYLAYDDGSSEAGYGINGLGSRNAMVACRFESYIPDTLRAIRICFNDSYLEANKRAFDLMVWDDNKGIPGNVIYSREEVMVEQENMINGSYIYNIPEGVVVNGKFYVGWKQRSETFLNAGFDINTPHSNRQLYWLNGEWLQSQMSGSLMIRPVLGDRLKITGINDIYYNKKKSQITIWPNPASDLLNISSGELQMERAAYVTFFDISGRELMKVPFRDQIDISGLHEGSYIIITSINGKPVGYNRLIKMR
jgi:hypothetical protein